MPEQNMNPNYETLTPEEILDLISLTKKLIQIPSSVNDGDEIYSFVEAYLKECELPVCRQSICNPYLEYQDYENLYVKLGNGKGPKIMLNGHLDTVGVEHPEHWMHPPFEGVEENGCIYGRGAADMKAGCAASIIALLALCRRVKNINGELFLSCVFGEEAPFSLGTDTLLREHNFDEYDLIIITEPSPLLSINDYCYTHDKIHKTKFPVTIVGAEGRIVLELEFQGKAAHASHPSLGVNALHDAATLISELARFDIFTNIKRGRGHYVVLNIEGGDPTFTVPEYCRLMINRQVMLGESPRTVVTEIEKIVEALHLKSKVKIYKQHSPDPLLEYQPYVNEESPYIDTFIETLCNVNHCEQPQLSYLDDACHCRFVTKSVGDFNLFGTRTKAPTIIFGPGGGNIHAPNEYVNKDEIITTANYLFAFLQKVFT